MRTRLSKISRELKAQISDIAEFLRENGYDCSEDPTEELSSEAVETIKYNFPAYISNKKGKEIPEKAKSKKEVSVDSSEQIPLELKIIEAASKEKKLIERVIGFTEFEWNYVVANYNGECSQPVDFNLFDEVICDLLLVEQMSAVQLGSIIGFDINKDPAEKEIILKAISDLKKDKMIDGDESVLWLTDIGKDYAKNGVKFSTFVRDFELYFDIINDNVANTKEIFSKLKSEKVSGALSPLTLEIDEIRKLAELQAPEIHFPKKGFQLQKSAFIKADGYKAKVWIVLLENFKDTKLRALVYDEKQNKIIEELSNSIDNREDIKADLLTKLISIDEDIEITEEQKPQEQVDFENQLISKQEEIEVALEKQEFEKIKEISQEANAIKRHFNSLEFEVELKRLFDETSDKLWIISPWIRFATLKRINFFEKYLKKGGTIFIAYSEPEQPDQIMALDEPLNKLLQLEKNYTNFYLHQLPPFHYKNVWLRTDNQQHMYYTGSYNILSFFVSQGLQRVRQEKMTKLDWNNEVQNEYEEVVKMFGLKYINKSIEDFNNLCQTAPKQIDRQFLQKLRTVDHAKLKPFLNSEIIQFDEAYEKLEETKVENLNLFRKQFFDQEIERFKRQLIDLTSKPISQDRKRSIQNEFEKIRDENMDFMDLQMKASKVKESIDNLKAVNFNNQGNNKKKRR